MRKKKIKHEYHAFSDGLYTVMKTFMPDIKQTVGMCGVMKYEGIKVV